MTADQWTEQLRALVEDPTEKKIMRLAKSIDAMIQIAEHDAFMEAKRIMQQSVDGLRWDLPKNIRPE